MIRRTAFILILAGCCAACEHAPDKGRTASREVPTEVESADAQFAEAERDSIRRQIHENWLPDPGTPGLEKMTVVVAVEMNPDGTVQSAMIQPSADGDNPNWRLFAESCRRAIFRSSPLKMPDGKPYAAWRHLILTFNAKEMFEL